jgi:hypothetical protein
MMKQGNYQNGQLSTGTPFALAANESPFHAMEGPDPGLGGASLALVRRTPETPRIRIFGKGNFGRDEEGNFAWRRSVR